MISDILAFIRGMPLRFYLSGGLFSKREPMISFHIGEQEIEALVSYKRKAIGFEDELHRDADAPPTMSYGQGYKPTVNGRKVSAKLASRYRVPQRCQHLFVVDAPADEVFLNLFTLEKLRRRNVHEALADLRQAPGQILSGWSRNDFRWHILDAGVRLSGEVNATSTSEDLILVLGLSESVCLPLEVWSDSQGAAIVGILPLPVAVLAWCNAVLPTDKKHSIVLVAGETGVVVGIIKERKLTNLLKVQTIEDALANVRRNADEFALENPAMYLWYSKAPAISDEELTQEGLTIIDQEHLRATLGEPLLLMQSTGKKATHDGPIPHLLNWLAKQ
jgi:hypothetical protein